MDRNRWLMVAGGVAAILFLAFLFLYQRGTPGGGLVGRVQNGIAQVTGGGKPNDLAADNFSFRRLEIDTSKPEAEACLVFTRVLDASGRTHYEDYLSVDPAAHLVARVVDNRLCLAGLAFDKTYNVTLKTGLPSAPSNKQSAEKLDTDETVPVELRDKPSLVRFAGGIVLPRDNAAGVPVTTVNVDKLTLKIIRVGDRLLSQIESGTVDQTTLYSWNANQLEQNQGSLVWSGSMKVVGVKNDTVVTLIPLRDLLKGQKPGAFVLVAGDAAKKKTNDEEDYSSQFATQWVIDSDMALTSFTSANPSTGAGLSVFARSYRDARPLSGVKLTLVGRNNAELATVTTDRDGRADFDAQFLRATGGDEPVVVMAYGRGGDFTFLDLRRSAFDLTDRGVGGRASPGPIDAFLYTERGVYRPGESVRAVAMLRDRMGVAADAPLTLIAYRPDGLEVGRTVVAGKALQAGATGWTLALGTAAPHGRWQISAFVDPKAAAIGRVQFDVADFVPQRLKVTLTAQEKAVRPGQAFHIRVESRFLYGAPASGLTGDGEAHIAADREPFQQWAGWQFGRVDDSFSDTKVNLMVPQTDAAGIAAVTGTVQGLADTTLPLKADVTVSIHEPGGRTTDSKVMLPIVTHDAAIGIHASFEGGSVAENSPARFEAIAVDAIGNRIAMAGVTYSWVREDTTYQWFQRNGEWRYQPSTRDRLITSGTVDIAQGASLKLAQAVPYGTYRLTLTDPKSGAASSIRFYSGWAASSAGDRPDRIPVAADKPSYAAGQTAHVHIKPDAPGKALVVVAGDKLFSSRVIDVAPGGTDVDVPVAADWGAGAYVLVTAYRPLAQASPREPVRSIGVAWLGVDNAPRTLSVAVGGADKIAPRQKISLPVTIKGLTAGEEAYVTLAAVDEGILQLTDYKSPDPVTYYFGKRRLGLLMRDDYGRLIRAEKAAVGILEQGGDSFGGRSLAVVPTRTVALFSGLVKVDAKGGASIPLDIPDFNGSLRLMAVAFSKTKLGHGDRMLIVRDPVVADIVLPRFLAPGDKSSAALNLDNVEGGAGAYVAVVRATGPVSLPGGQMRLTQTLNRGQRVLLPVPLTGSGLGIATVALEVTGPNNFRVAHDWQIEIRAPQLDITREEEVPLAAGGVYSASSALLADFMPGTATVSLSVSAAHGYNNVGSLLRWLDKYPFGCLEQTTSRAMPLLTFNDLADLAKLPRDRELRGRVQDAIDRVLDMQNLSGDFGMWSSGDSADAFLSVYALDFLTQAKAKGYVVPNVAMGHGIDWLKSTAGNSNDELARAYAFYVLAENGQGNISDLRYFSDTRVAKMRSGLAAALTGAAAAQMGDRSRAQYGFDRAVAILTSADPIAYPRSNDYYGSLLRDVSGAMALAAESGQSDRLMVLLDRSKRLNMKAEYTTTQEKGWMLRAAYALTRQKLPLNVTLNGVAAPLREGAVRLAPTAEDLKRGLTLVNKGEGTVWRSTAVSGTPASALPAVADGLTLTKTIWTMSGALADPAKLKLNDRVIVEISGTMPNDLYHQIGMIDLLPAGLSIEQALAPGDSKAYGFLGTLTETNVGDARDDRFVSVFDIGSRFHMVRADKPEPMPQFHIAYIARATAAGQFALPAADAVDMYAPAVHARTAMSRAVIAP